MTLPQAIVFLLFIATCIIVTYMNSRRMIGLRKQRDTLAQALAHLLQDAVRSAPHINAALSVVAARKAIREVLGSERVKE